MTSQRSAKALLNLTSSSYGNQYYTMAAQQVAHPAVMRLTETLFASKKSRHHRAFTDIPARDTDPSASANSPLDLHYTTNNEYNKHLNSNPSHEIKANITYTGFESQGKKGRIFLGKTMIPNMMHMT